MTNITVHPSTTRSHVEKISRRQLLSVLAVAPVGAAAPWRFAPKPTHPGTFVLVHGAWHGGWCWGKVEPLLRASGHRVFAPTLTGMGERSHLIAPEIDLETHIQDVVQVIEYEDLQNVVLVGHSYGGMVVSGVSEAAGRRIGHVVYLDAFLPEDGKAVADYAPVPPTRPDGWRIPVMGSARDFGVTNDDDVAWADPRLGDQPLRTFTQPVDLSPEAQRAVPKTFVRCSETPWFVEAAERARRQGFWVHEMLSAGHDAMITQPEELSRVLLGLT